MEEQNTTMEQAIIIDDDPVFSRLLTTQLTRAGYTVEAFASPIQAIERLATSPSPSIVLLDYYLGKHNPNGLELCLQIKSGMDIPVIMLTANDDNSTIVQCLDAGADQYIVKPHHYDELLARIRAVIRLYKKNNVSNQIETETRFGNLLLNDNTRTLTIDGHTIQLTEKENVAAKILIRNYGETLERETLYQELYGIDYNPLNRSVDMLLARLRKKLETPATGLQLQPVRNRGYRLILTPAE